MAYFTSGDVEQGVWKVDAVPPFSNDITKEPAPAWAGTAQCFVNRWQCGQSDQACAAASTETAAAGWSENHWGNWHWHEPVAAQQSERSWGSMQRDKGRPATSVEAGNSRTKTAMAHSDIKFKAYDAGHSALAAACAARAAECASSSTVGPRGSAAPDRKAAPAKAAPTEAVPFRPASARATPAPTKAMASLARHTAAPARAMAGPPAVANAALDMAQLPPRHWPPSHCLPTGHMLDIWDGSRYMGECFRCHGLLLSNGLRCQKCERLFCQECCDAAVSPVQQPMSPPLQQPVWRPAATADEALQPVSKRRLILFEDAPSELSWTTIAVPGLHPQTGLLVSQPCPPRAAANTSSSSSTSAHHRTLPRPCCLKQLS